MNGSVSDRTFGQWLDEYKDEIEQAALFSISDLPDEPAARGTQLGRANSECARMGFLLADAESFVLKAHAGAVVAVRKSHGDLSAGERNVVAKSDEDYVAAVRARDDLQVIVSALSRKSYAIMNLNKTTFHPAQSDHGQ